MEYMKVILVDDEPIVIQDMMSIIDWNSCGFQIIGTSHSAAGALRLMQIYKPDVVFMDVSMPSMDGLDLSAKLKEIYPSVIIVILSGYMDFNYAQRAISLGIYSYLVKHQLTKEVLEKELKNIKNNIYKRKKDSILLRSQIILSVLGMENYYKSITREEKNYLEVYEKPFIFFLLTPILPCLSNKKNEEPIYVHVSTMRNKLEKRGIPLLDIFVIKGTLMVTVRSEAGVSKAGLLTEIQTISMHLREALDISMFTVCFSHTTTLPELYEEYHLLKRYCEQYIFEGKSTLLIVENTRNYTSQSIETDFLNEQMFFNDYQEIQRKLEQGFHKCILTKNSKAFYQYCDGILELIKKIDPQYEYDHLQIFTSSDAKEIGELFLGELENFHREFFVREKYSAMSNYIIRYINKNFQSAPTLNEIASQLNGNSIYIGQKFRKDTGMSFNEYLTERRIRFAKSLLRTTNLKTAEIAEKSGFSGGQYFCRIFKEQTGMTPIEYRQHFLEV